MNENKTKNSLERCKALVRGYNYSGSPARAEDVQEILAVMQDELLIHGYSPLLSAAYAACCKKYPKESWSYGSEWLKSNSDKMNMSTMDGEYWILFLGDAINGNLQKSALFYWMNYIFREYEDQSYLWNDIRTTLDFIQKWIIRRRRELVMSASGKENTANAASTAAQQPDTSAKNLAPQTDRRQQNYAQKEAEKILRAAQQERADLLAEAEKKKKQILDNAQKETEQLKTEVVQMREEVKQLKAERKRVEDEGRRLEAEAKQRASKLTSDVLAKRFAQEQGSAFCSLDALRKALQDISSQMRNVEKRLMESNTQKASRQLLELYDIIADLRDSAADQLDNDPSGAYSNTVHNMDMLLMLVVDALSEYGITNINTLPGEPFSGKYHEVHQSISFNPQGAVVARSMRDGFVWGEQVIRKEKIKLQEEECD